MKAHTHTAHNHNRIQEPVNNLVEDTKALVSATTELAEDKMIEAIKRGKAVWKNARTKTIAGAKAADTVIRDNPYRSLAIAAGVGGLLGFLLARRK